MAEEGGFQVKAVWNSDDAQLRIIFELKEMAASYFLSRDLEELYWTIRSMRREIDAKLNPTEKTDLKSKLEEIDNKRDKLLHDKKNSEIANEFFISLEDFYITISSLMKKHGLYFREADDPRKAITG